MDKYWKDKWVDALRSGNYVQTEGTLCQVEDGPDGVVDTYCCLGVLCELVPGIIKEELDDDDDDGIVFQYTYNKTSGIGRLPRDISGIAHLSVGVETTLVQINDDGASFEEIADYIENNL
jgi:hypothetical protein